MYAGNNEDYQVAEAEGLKWNSNDGDAENWLRGTFPARYIYDSEKLLPEMVKKVVKGRSIIRGVGGLGWGLMIRMLGIFISGMVCPLERHL